MSIWFLGDVHSGFDHIRNALDATDQKPDALIFLGDQECPRPFEECVAPFEKMGIPSYFIIGNHDTDTAANLRNLFSSEFSTERNLNGRVLEIAGLRIAGLGGVFRSQIWFPQFGNEEPIYRSYDEFMKASNVSRPTRLRRKVSKAALLQYSDYFPKEHQAELEEATKEGETRKHLSSIFPDDYDRLASLKADILVTHEAPAPHPHGFQVLTDLGALLGVQHCFHGHQHDNLNYSAHIESVGYQMHGVGLRGISDELGHVIWPGELDAARQTQKLAKARPL